MAAVKYLSLPVNNCARCNQNHSNIEFIPFTIPPLEYTYWGMCPAVNEPILLCVVDE